MDKQRVLIEINAIYQNCKAHMKNTAGDWEKAFGAFRKLLEKYDNDVWVNKQIQKVIIILENYLKE